jgi:putrescine aminotransferase
MMLTNLSTADLQRIDEAHHIHPFTDHGTLQQDERRVIVRADGVWIWDSEGNRILDGMAGLWCVNTGHGRQEIAEAVRAQMSELSYYNTFFKTTNMPAIELGETLAELAPTGLNKVFYSSSGSEANDTVFRMVRHFWASQGRPEKQVIIGRHNGYHGSTLAGVSLGGMNAMHGQGGLPVPGVVHIAQPHWFAEGYDQDPDAFGLATARALEQMIDEVGEENIAAFIAEPVQGAGGVVVPPASYWPEIQRILNERDILFVSDEVICGFGRTGSWFGCQTYGTQPDMITIAKGLSSGYLPISGVMINDRVADGLAAGGEFFHGYTYSGHPAACAAAIANLKILKRENLVQTTADVTGPYLAQKWHALADHPLVGHTRAVGLMAGLELVPDHNDPSRRFEDQGYAGGVCRDFCVEAGVVMRAVGDAMMISPPLSISTDEIDELVARATSALDATYAALASENKIA